MGKADNIAVNTYSCRDGSCYDLNLLQEQKISFGANYYFKPIGNSLYLSLNYFLNRVGTIYTNGVGNPNNVTFFHGGYRYESLKFMDLKLGLGFGYYNEQFIPSFDISIGFNIPKHDN